MTIRAEGVLYFFESGLASFDCPACKRVHTLRIEGDGAWSWNKNVNKPTFQPSLLCTGTKTVTDEEYNAFEKGAKLKPVKWLCHSFITDGEIQYLSDCTHEFAGKTLPMTRAFIGFKD